MSAAMPAREDLTPIERAIYEKACSDLWDLLVFMRAKGWSGTVVARVSLDGQRIRAQRVNGE